jgi:hypothetical protein
VNASKDVSANNDPKDVAVWIATENVAVANASTDVI